MVGQTEDDTVDARPQRRKPLIAGSGWLLFVCAFLPTLRVCSEPIAPYQFPPAYVVHLGAAVLAIIAALRVLRTRRNWFTAWFMVCFATALTWISLTILDVSSGVALLLIVGGIPGAVFAGIAFHRAKFTARGMWIGSIVHGAISTVWYVLLAGDSDAMWGAYVGLASSIGLLLASARALVQHMAELARIRRETEPAPLPIARVVR